MTRFTEKVKYKPVPVSTLFLEMKNLSELMIALAYSAALFNDKDLATEVIELEKRVDTLAYQLEMTIMLAARDPRDAESLTGISTVASAADRISDAAADIAAIVTQNIGIHPIVREIFDRVEEHLVKAIVPAGSEMIGKTVADLNLAAQMAVDLIAMRRGEDWIVNPSPAERIREGDVLIVRGVSSSATRFMQLTGSSTISRGA